MCHVMSATANAITAKRWKYSTKENIHEVLEMTVEDAHEFFSAVPVIRRKLQTLLDVGLGYIRLGQSATTLSGGEAQRVKLALELSNGIPAARCTFWMNRPPACISTISHCC
jgi:excinuclease UvrABC ATPase subunit